MARQCCRDSVAMKIVADDTAETEGYVTPCRWCERHATYRGGRWIFSEDEPLSVRHATAAALMTHPDRVARIAEVLGKPRAMPCVTCGQPLLAVPVDNVCPTCGHDFLEPAARKPALQGTLSDLQMEMDRHHGKQWKDI